MKPADALLLRLQQHGIIIVDQTGFEGSGADLPLLSLTSPPNITLGSTGGRGPVIIQNGSKLRQPAFQVIARHRRWPTAEALAEAAWEVLNFSNVQIADKFFLWCRPQQEVYDHGKDAAGNLRAAFNILTCWR